MMYALFPKGSKPSKSVSADRTRPALNRAELREAGDGWELLATDSYQLARIPLDVHEDDGGALVAGPIPLDALKACEKAGGFRADGTVEPVDGFGRPTGASFARPTVEECGRFPNVDQLTPEYEPAQTVEIGLNPELLQRLAQALGRSKNAPVKLTVSLREDSRRAGGAFTVGRTMLVDVGDAHGLLMPIRLS